MEYTARILAGKLQEIKMGLNLESLTTEQALEKIRLVHTAFVTYAFRPDGLKSETKLQLRIMKI